MLHSFLSFRNVENWHELVRKCTCNQSTLNKQSVRLFGRRIRRYMLAYLGIETAKAKQADDSTASFLDLNFSVPEMSVQLVERLVKVHKSPHKTHRNILDSEQRFLKQVVEWVKVGDNVEEVICCDD